MVIRDRERERERRARVVEPEDIERRKHRLRAIRRGLEVGGVVGTAISPIVPEVGIPLAIGLTGAGKVLRRWEEEPEIVEEGSEYSIVVDTGRDGYIAGIVHGSKREAISEAKRISKEERDWVEILVVNERNGVVEWSKRRERYYREEPGFLEDREIERERGLW